MPLVRIEVRKGRTASELRRIADAVHRSLVEVFDVPERDRFQVIAEHDAAHFIFDPAYLDVPRSDGIVFIEVTLSAGRTPGKKQVLYARLAALLGEAAVRPEDVAVCLVENQRDCWSFGNGEAQYLTRPREQWR